MFRGTVCSITYREYAQHITPAGKGWTYRVEDDSYTEDELFGTLCELKDFLAKEIEKFVEKPWYTPTKKGLEQITKTDSTASDKPLDKHLDSKGNEIKIGDRVRVIVPIVEEYGKTFPVKLLPGMKDYDIRGYLGSETGVLLEDKWCEIWMPKRWVTKVKRGRPRKESK